jgi:hypothetical protein
VGAGAGDVTAAAVVADCAGGDVESALGIVIEAQAVSNTIPMMGLSAWHSRVMIRTNLNLFKSFSSACEGPLDHVLEWEIRSLVPVREISSAQRVTARSGRSTTEGNCNMTTMGGQTCARGEPGNMLCHSEKAVFGSMTVAHFTTAAYPPGQVCRRRPACEARNLARRSESTLFTTR